MSTEKKEYASYTPSQAIDSLIRGREDDLIKDKSTVPIAKQIALNISVKFYISVFESGAYDTKNIDSCEDAVIDYAERIHQWLIK
jgi:hypothetical protein